MSNSLCCPSRATFLRGQYSNNHGTITNWGPEGAYPKFVELGRDQDNLVTRLDAQGYTTAHFGKYLNRYNGNEHGKPPGWDRFAFVNDGTGGNRYWEDGRWGIFPDFHDDYTVQRSADFIGSTRGQDAPFYLQVDLHSPHAPYVPPPRYAGAHAETPIDQKPSFSEDISDKPQWVKDTKTWTRTTDEVARFERTKENRRKILEETEVVADALARVKTALSDAGKDRKTYVIFTSDNGLQLGEHGLPFYKTTPYEEAVRVPLMVQGPGIAPGTVADEMVVNNDLAPTILDWVGAGAPAYMDGRSLAPLAAGFEPTWRDAIMVEHWVDTHMKGDDLTPPSVPFYKMVRTASGGVYVEYSTDEREYYDLTKDPYQMENGADVPENAARIAELQEKLEQLKACSGASCRKAEGTTGVEFTAPANNSYDTDGILTFSGTAAPNGAVDVFEGATVRATTTADAQGNWKATLEGVADGRHSYVAKATDAAGKASSSVPRTVTVDATEPRVTGRVPDAKAADVWRAANLTATFSEAMKGSTVNGTTFKLVRRGTASAVGATVVYDATAKKATLNPRDKLVRGASYVVTVGTGARDLAGNALDQNPAAAGGQGAVWSFTVRR